MPYLTPDEHEILAARVTLAHHMAAMGGWLTAGYIDMRDLDATRTAMLADEHIEPGQRDRIHTYELTDAGRAWLAEQEG